MHQLRRAFSRFVNSFRTGRAETELSREITAHLQLLEDQFVAKGMTRDEARYAAKRAFGGVEQAKELQRDARSFRWLAGWPMDLKLGARMLVKSPGITVIAVIALAVAFGAGATYLEFVNGLVRPALRFPGGDRLVGIASTNVTTGFREFRVVDHFKTWREHSTLIELLGGYQSIHSHRDIVSDDGRGVRPEGVRVSAVAFQLVPSAPLLGRPLVAGDEHPSAPLVAVIGESFWTSHFHRSPDVVGQSLTIDNERYTIVGVMPRSFRFPVNHVLWVPLRIDDPARPWVTVFGRLREGASIDAAQAEIDAVSRRVATPAGAERRVIRSQVDAYVPALTGSIEFDGDNSLALYAVNLVFVAFLCVCAANVATLVFGRTIARQGEIAVRGALGASRGRIVSQLVAEALVLTSVAALAGLGFTKLLLRWVEPIWRQGQGSEMPFWWNERLDVDTILYTAVLAVVAALIVGGVPGLKATGRDMQGRLKLAGGAGTLQFGRLWTYIIVLQVAFTVVFLLGVVAMGWSFRGITEQFENVAFERAHYATGMLEVTIVHGEPEPKGPAYRPADAFLDMLRASPAIQNVTYTTRLPAVDQAQTYFDIDGVTVASRVAHVGPDFFQTFDRRFIAGRDFAMTELESGANVAIVDESFVRFALGGRSAVGRQVRVKDPATGELGPFVEIIGVTADMSSAERKTLRDARVYRPIGASGQADVHVIAHARPGFRQEGLGALVKTFREAAAVAPAGRPLRGLGTLEGGSEGDVIEYVLAALGIVGAVALLLATAGIYALVSFTLSSRTREIGIRTALGASPRRIVTGVLARAMAQIAIGVAGGAVPGFFIAGSVASEMGRNGLAEGLVAAAAVSLFVLIVAALSCAVPLRRALGVQPTEALRTT